MHFQENTVAQERFEKQEEHERAGGQHGTRNVDDADVDSASDASTQPSQDPQLRRVHEGARIKDDLGRGNETSMEDGGARHRQQ
jgi:hypothetical protein